MIASAFENLLRRLDERGREERDEQWENEVGEALIELRESYDSLTDENRVAIDYSSLATQAAYVFAYAIGRAEFTYQLLKRHRLNLGKPIFGSKAAKITSLGGGPGSELAGIVKYLLDPESGEKVKSLKYWVFDKDGDWAESCSELIKEISDHFPVELIFDTLDLTDVEACGRVSLEGDDMLVLSFIISELCALKENQKALESLRGLYRSMDSGASIFYNDSNASSFYYFFNDSRKFVKGIASRASQKSEIVDNITFAAVFGEKYQEYNDLFDSTPHMTSNALSKLIQRP